MNADKPKSEAARTLGENCQHKRRRWQMSISVLADKTGIPASQITYIEQGLGNPTLKDMAALCGGASNDIALAA